MKNKKYIILSIIILLIGGYLLYFFPIQRYFAEKTFIEYIKMQGTSEENIKSKETFKDYKQNGYFIEVIYKDDPSFMYDYKYSVDTLKDMNSYKSIRCIVYNKMNQSVEVSDEANIIKYPPLGK